MVGRETLKDKKDTRRRDQEEIRVMRCSHSDLNESPLTKGGHMCILWDKIFLNELFVFIYFMCTDVLLVYFSV